jgi:hypothetical protein
MVARDSAMLEPLTGRLKWESLGDGIRVIIPSRFSWWLFLPSGLGLLTLPHFTYEVYWKVAHTHATGPRSFIPEWLGLSILVIWIALFRTHKIVLTLTPTEMRVEKRALGLGLRTSTSATSRLSELQFIPSQYGVTVDDQSRIQLRKDNKTRSFAMGIREDEADALIDKMMEIYSFPKFLPTASVTEAKPR